MRFLKYKKKLLLLCPNGSPRTQHFRGDLLYLISANSLFFFKCSCQLWRQEGVEQSYTPAQIQLGQAPLCETLQHVCSESCWDKKQRVWSRPGLQKEHAASPQQQAHSLPGEHPLTPKTPGQSWPLREDSLHLGFKGGPRAVWGEPSATYLLPELYRLPPVLLGLHQGHLDPGPEAPRELPAGIGALAGLHEAGPVWAWRAEKEDPY